MATTNTRPLNDQNQEFKVSELNNITITVGPLTADRIIQFPSASNSHGMRFRVAIHATPGARLILRSGASDMHGLIMGQGLQSACHPFSNVATLTLDPATYPGSIIEFLSDGYIYYIHAISVGILSHIVPAEIDLL